MGLKIFRKLFPASPDQIIRNAQYKEAALPRFAHLNELVDQVNDIAAYSIDLSAVTTLAVTTSKGIIAVTIDTGASDPDPAFATSVSFTITNDDIPADLNSVYVQVTPYYTIVPAADDLAIPYVIVAGNIADTITLSIYNASPTAAGADQWTGVLYLYYEIRTLV